MSFITISLKSINCFYKENGFPLQQVQGLYNQTDSSTSQAVSWANTQNVSHPKTGSLAMWNLYEKKGEKPLSS